MPSSTKERHASHHVVRGHVLSQNSHDWLNRHIDIMVNPALAEITILRPPNTVIVPKPANGELPLDTAGITLVDTPRQDSVNLAQVAINPCELFAHEGAVRPTDNARLETRRSTIAALIPAKNEEHSIGATIESVLRQTRPVDHIFIICNNCTDNTAAVARGYAVRYSNITVFEVDTDNNGVIGKVGGLNYGFMEAEFVGYDFIVGADSDVLFHPRAIELLEQEIIRRDTVAAIRARYSLRTKLGLSFLNRRLMDQQSMEFADTEMKDQVRKGKTAIVGGQGSIFRMEALRQVMEEYHRPNGPWSGDSKVEDAELTQVLRDMGWEVRVSKRARVEVDGMPDGRKLENQRFKWQFGHIQDMVRRFLKHPISGPWKDRLQWAVQFNLLANTLTRVVFFTLLAASVSQHAFVFRPIWLIPIAETILLSFLTALKTPNRTSGTVGWSLCFVFSELYLWRAIAVFVLSWTYLLSGRDIDAWSSQANAENSTKAIAWRTWFTLGAVFLGPAFALTLAVTQMPYSTWNNVLYHGWLGLTVWTVFCMAWVAVRIVFGRVVRLKSLQP